MGKDRRKRDRRQATDDNSVETNAASDAFAPRGQREPRSRAGQERRETPVKRDALDKPADETSAEKREETKEAPPDPAVLFANLKRETDDIKALTEKKFSKRQIFSNWSRYDEPLPDPVREEEESPGADFEVLCAVEASSSSYFQLKSERAWNTNISALSSELFSLNADNLAQSLGSIPFYERLDLPIELFTDAEIQKMKRDASYCKKTDVHAKKEMDILNILRERSNAEDNLPLNSEREKTPDHKPTLSFSIDRPESPDDFDEPPMAEEPKCSPEINSKMSEPSPEKQLTNLQSFEESMTRHEEDIPDVVTQRDSMSCNVTTISQVIPPRQSKDKIVEPGITADEASTRESEQAVTEDLNPQENIHKPLESLGQRSKKIRSKDKGQHTNRLTEMSTQKHGNTVVEEMPERSKNASSLKERSQPTVASEKVKSPSPLEEKQKPLIQTVIPEKAKSPSPLEEKQKPLIQTMVPEKAKSPSPLEEKPNSFIHTTVPEKAKSPSPLEEKPKPVIQATAPEKTPSIEKHVKPMQAKVPEPKVKPAEKVKPKPVKVKQDDDLDFLLSLKKPVRGPQVTPGACAQVAKPSIEEDDASVKPAGPKFPQQTEDLEDWLDSVLDD